MENYYDILGVSKNASEDEIKKSYKKLAAKYHPDRYASKSETERKEAEAKFKEINEAYQTLSDPQKKQHYDMFGSMDGFGQGGPNMGGFGGFGGFDMGDIFDMFSGGRHRRSQGQSIEPGQTIEVQVPVSIEEILNGGTKEVEVKINVRCSDCNGEGGTGVETCPYCHGTGMVTETRQQGYMTMQTSHPCGHCHGTGKTIKNKCKTCGGTGFVTKTQKVNVNIPIGVDNGYRIKYTGKGYESKNPKGANGDLIITFIHSYDSSKYKVIGSNIFEHVKVPYYDCILGADKKITLPNGKQVNYKIPSFTEENDQITLYGHGINRGNYILVVSIEIPSKTILNKEENLLKEIKKLHEK